MYYVEIEVINGRYEFYQLVKRLEECGFDNVEYHAGGWIDNQISSVLPHLKFKDRNDALYYVLAHGGKISEHIPIRHTEEMEK